LSRIWSANNDLSSKLHIRPTASISALYCSKVTFHFSRVFGLITSASRLIPISVAGYAVGLLYPWSYALDLLTSALIHGRSVGVSFRLFARILAPLRILRKRIGLAILLHDRLFWPLSGPLPFTSSTTCRPWLLHALFTARKLQLGYWRFCLLGQSVPKLYFSGPACSHSTLLAFGMCGLQFYDCLFPACIPQG
jgi:hypothetical protein